jgi:hypothetical protein
MNQHLWSSHQSLGSGTHLRILLLESDNPESYVEDNCSIITMTVATTDNDTAPSHPWDD